MMLTMMMIVMYKVKSNNNNDVQKLNFDLEPNKTKKNRSQSKSFKIKKIDFRNIFDFNKRFNKGIILIVRSQYNKMCLEIESDGSEC